MLVVIGLGGGALAIRGQPITAEGQRAQLRLVAQRLAPLARKHRLVVEHGAGPQAGLLGMQAAVYAQVETYPIDVSGAQIEAMTGHVLEQELANLLAPGQTFATLLTMAEVDLDDPAFRYPSKFIGPVYLREEAEHLSEDKGWVFKPEGDKWRRVVASPEPKHIFELRAIERLVRHGTIVIASGGGGVPATYEKGPSRRLVGVDCLIDTDMAAQLLARELEADLFLMITDVDAVYADWGRPTQKAIRRASPQALRSLSLAAGSMEPKVDAACRFAEATGKAAVIGALQDLDRIIAGRAGTTISTDEDGVTCDAAIPVAKARSS